MRRIKTGDRDKLARNVRDAISELNAEIDKWNSARNEHAPGIEAAQTKLNEALDEARNWRDQLVSEMESYVEERSDKWKDSDAASEYEDFKQAFENLEIDDVEIELPEELEQIDEERADNIDNLPESVETT